MVPSRVSGVFASRLGVALQRMPSTTQRLRRTTIADALLSRAGMTTRNDRLRAREDDGTQRTRAASLRDARDASAHARITLFSSVIVVVLGLLRMPT